jgi:hypothetical protein
MPSTGRGFAAENLQPALRCAADADDAEPIGIHKDHLPAPDSSHVVFADEREPRRRESSLVHPSFQSVIAGFCATIGVAPENALSRVQGFAQGPCITPGDSCERSGVTSGFATASPEPFCAANVKESILSAPPR